MVCDCDIAGVIAIRYRLRAGLPWSVCQPLLDAAVARARARVVRAVGVGAVAANGRCTWWRANAATRDARTKSGRAASATCGWIRDALSVRVLVRALAASSENGYWSA